MSFSEQLKVARIKKGYTQQKVADLMGITNSTYCGYETGKRQPDVLKIKQLANILDTSGDFLLETGYEKKQSHEYEGLSDFEKSIVSMVRSVPSDRRGDFLAVLEAALKMQR